MRYSFEQSVSPYYIERRYYSLAPKPKYGNVQTVWERVNRHREKAKQAKIDQIIEIVGPIPGLDGVTGTGSPLSSNS
jgi:hypothetical protein